MSCLCEGKANRKETKRRGNGKRESESERLQTPPSSMLLEFLFLLCRVTGLNAFDISLPWAPPREGKPKTKETKIKTFKKQKNPAQTLLHHQHQQQLNTSRTDQRASPSSSDDSSCCFARIDRLSSWQQQSPSRASPYDMCNRKKGHT